VSQSEGGYEAVYQSSVVVPHWHVTADERGHWEVDLEWNLDHISARANVARLQTQKAASALPA
jgi:alpha-amylase